MNLTDTLYDGKFKIYVAYNGGYYITYPGYDGYKLAGKKLSNALILIAELIDTM